MENPKQEQSQWLQPISWSSIQGLDSRTKSMVPLLFDSEGLLSNGRKRSVKGMVVAPTGYVFPPDNRERESLFVCSAEIQLATSDPNAVESVSNYLKPKVSSVVQLHKVGLSDGSIFEDSVVDEGHGKKSYKTATQNTAFKECTVLLGPKTETLLDVTEASNTISELILQHNNSTPNCVEYRDSLPDSIKNEIDDEPTETVVKKQSSSHFPSQQRSILQYFPRTPTNNSGLKRSANEQSKITPKNKIQLQTTSLSTPRRLFSRNVRKRFNFSPLKEETSLKTPVKSLIKTRKPNSTLKSRRLSSKLNKVLSSSFITRQIQLALNSPHKYCSAKVPKKNRKPINDRKVSNIQNDLPIPIDYESSPFACFVSLPLHRTRKILQRQTSVQNSNQKILFKTPLVQLRAKFTSPEVKKDIRVIKILKETDFHQPNFQDIPTPTLIEPFVENLIEPDKLHGYFDVLSIASPSHSAILQPSNNTCDEDICMDTTESVNHSVQVDQDVIEDILSLEDDLHFTFPTATFDDVQNSWKNFFNLYSDVKFSSLVSPEDFESLMFQLGDEFQYDHHQFDAL